MISVRSRRPVISVFAALFFIFELLTLVHAAEIPPIEPFEKSDRVLIVSPHPDDDIIACAGVIQRALASGAKVKVVYITCGDNNIGSVFLYTDLPLILCRNKIFYLVELIMSWRERFAALGRIRIDEAIRAQKILGLNESDLVFLGYPDHGTDQMFIFNWDHTKPYSYSLGGYSSVPYEKGLRGGRVYTADNIIDDLKGIIEEFKPTKIFVAHSSDVNGDHWASYLYTLVSLSDLSGAVPAPKIYPYIVHVPDWPLPRNYHPNLPIEPPEKFFGGILPLIEWRQLKLTPQEIEKKHEAMKMHESQMYVSAFYLLSFVRKNEIFGDFPTIVLKRQDPSRMSEDEDLFTADMKWIGYAVVDDSLWVRVRQSEDADEGMDLTFFIAGMKSGVEFAKMPNIMVTAFNNKLSIYNSTEDRYVSPVGASLEVDQDWVTLKIPLEALGDPQSLIFGLETDAQHIPEGCTAFRIIKIEEMQPANGQKNI